MKKLISVTIKGTSPLLMHCFPLSKLPDDFQNLEPKKQAEYASYRDPETKQLYIPGIAIQRCLVGSAIYSKGKGRASLQKQVAACVLISPERCSLGINDFILDSRAVVVPATKGRIIRHRPRLEEWQASFEVEYDSALLSENDLRQIVDNAGSRVGLLDFRPEKKGPFGRFVVVNWQS